MKKLSLVLALVACVASAEDSRRIAFQTALPAKVAPKMDGVLDDACWQEADWNDRYYEYVKADPKRVSPGTRNIPGGIVATSPPTVQFAAFVQYASSAPVHVQTVPA